MLLDAGMDVNALLDSAVLDARNPRGVNGLQETARRRVLREIGGAAALAGISYRRRPTRWAGERGPRGAMTRCIYEPSRHARNALASIHREAPIIHELGDAPSDAIIFHEAISAAVGTTPYGTAVHVYSPEEYRRMRLLLTADGRAGFALKADDIVSVFRNRSGPRTPSAADALLLVAVLEGGRRLDAFDTVLPRIYAAHGFTAVARTRWDDRYAPPGWDKTTFAQWNFGEPDVVYMAYHPVAAGREYSGQSEGAFIDPPVVWAA